MSPHIRDTMKEENTKRGPKSKYQKKYAQQVEKLCKLGATDAEIANFFEVTEQTINNWKTEYPEFNEALRRGKLEADAEVADRLYQRAMGFEHDAEELKVVSMGGKEGSAVERHTVRKIYPPDTQAAIHWLKNRQPDKWRDQKDFNHKHQGEPFDMQKALEDFFGSDERDR